MAFVFAALRTGSASSPPPGSSDGSPTSSRPCSCWPCSSPRRSPPSATGGGPWPPHERRHGDATPVDGRSRRVIWDVLSSSILYDSAFRLAVLFVLAATGEWMAERAGTLNISLEGMIIAGAFGAAVGSSTFDSVWVGLGYAARGRPGAGRGAGQPQPPPDGQPVRGRPHPQRARARPHGVPRRRARAGRASAPVWSRSRCCRTSRSSGTALFGQSVARLHGLRRRPARLVPGVPDPVGARAAVGAARTRSRPTSRAST